MWSWIPDGTHLSYLSALIGLVGAVLGFINRKDIRGMWKGRAKLSADLGQAVATRDDAIRRADAAEHLARDYKLNLDELRARVDEIKIEIADLRESVDKSKLVEAKLDALVEWTKKVLEYIIWIESRARSGGVDLRGRKLPALPAVLADRIEIPAALQ